MLTPARAAAGGAAALTLLVACAASPAAAVRVLAELPDAVDPVAPLVAAVTLAAWALAAWLATAVLLTLLSRSPSLLGRASSALVRRWAPTAVRRSLEMALGLTAATGALGTGTVHALPMPVSADAVRPVVGQPSAAAGLPTPAHARPSEPVPFDLDWPRSARPSPPTTTPPSARADERTPRPGSGAPAGKASVGPSPTAGRDGAPTAVVVRPGDTLWGLAETSLRRAGVAEPSDSRIAQTWPRWWAANRDVIGDDPHLILPGTVLSPPVDRAPGADAGP